MSAGEDNPYIAYKDQLMVTLPQCIWFSMPYLLPTWATPGIAGYFSQNTSV